MPHHMLAMHSKLHAAEQATKEGWISTDTCHAMLCATDTPARNTSQLSASHSDTHLGHSTKRRSCSCCTRCSIRRACVSCQLLSRCCSGADGTSRLSKGYSLHKHPKQPQQRNNSGLDIPAACHMCASCQRCKQQGEQHRVHADLKVLYVRLHTKRSSSGVMPYCAGSGPASAA